MKQDSLYNNNAGPRDLPRRQSVQYGNTVVMEVVVSSDIMLVVMNWCNVNEC